MPVSRETVLYYDPRGGEQTAVLKSILVQMGARIENVAPEAVGQTVRARKPGSPHARRADARVGRFYR